MKLLLTEQILTNNYLEKLLNLDSNIFKELDLNFSYLGGSLAKGRFNWWSDIDIFICKKNLSDLSSKEKYRILLKLNSKLSSELNFDNIQIIFFNNLPLHIQFNVIKDGILLFESEKTDRLRYIENILNKYYDHIIWYNNMINISFGRSK